MNTEQAAHKRRRFDLQGCDVVEGNDVKPSDKLLYSDAGPSSGDTRISFGGVWMRRLVLQTLSRLGHPPPPED